MRFRTLWGLWAFNYVSGHLAEARGLADRLERSARAAPARDGRSGYLLEAFRASASTTFTLGNVGRARARFKEALRLYDPARHQNHAHAFAVEPSIVCWSYLTVCDVLVRGAAQGLKTCDALMGRAVAQPHLFSRVYACYWASCSHQLCGDVERARQAAEDGLALSRQQFPQWDAMNEIIRAWCIARLEDPSKGVELLEAGLEKHERTGARTIRPYFLMLLAEARLIRGTSDAARQALDLALAAATRTHEHTWTTQILQRRAELGPRPLAARMLKRAMKMASRQETGAFRLPPLADFNRAPGRA
jgi:predicted ATPase